MRLSLQTDGPLPRLLAPGVPDWLGTDGVRVGWTLRDRLFLVDGESVTVVSLPAEVEDVTATPERWVIALPNGTVTVDPSAATVTAALVDDDANPVTTRAGDTLVLFVEVPEHRLLRRLDGAPVALPDAATRAKFIRPWTVGDGACWVDFDTLYRLRAGGRIAALGKSPGPEGLGVGPNGAVVVALKSDTVVAAAGGLAQRVGERVEADSARFHADGKRALVATERGAAELDLATGGILRRWDGELAPVGYLADEPLLWDVSRGTILDAEGSVLRSGFAGAMAGLDGDVLAGPGGAVWRLSDGTRLRDDVHEGACAVRGDLVAHVRADRARLLSPPSDRVLAAPSLDEDDALERAWFEGELLVAQTLDGVRLSWSGDGATVVATTTDEDAPEALVCEGVVLPEPGEDSVVTEGTRAWPLPADLAVRGAAGLYVATDDGMLTLLG